MFLMFIVSLARPKDKFRYRDNQQRRQEVIDEVQQEAL